MRQSLNPDGNPQINVPLHPELFKKLRVRVALNNTTNRVIIEEALWFYLEYLEQQEKRNVKSQD